MNKYPLIFKLNGRTVSVEAPAHINLLTLLRDYLNVTGPKVGCEQGDCGACTVQLDGEAVNSCLVLALTVQGREVTTIEGIGSPGHPHPLQQAFVDHYGAQCGFCTPGMIVSSKTLLDENHHPSREDVAEALEGNICRCTGYQKITEAVLAAAEVMFGADGGPNPPGPPSLKGRGEKSPPVLPPSPINGRGVGGEGGSHA